MTDLVAAVFDPLFSLAHSMQSNKGVFTVLLGSGISRSSGIPTGWEVTLDLARRLAKLHGVDPADDVEGWYQAQFGKAPDYSDLLDALAKSPAERRSLLHGYFEPTEEEREQGLKLPSPAHRAIAKLAARGYIRVILTTNFDKLTEAALRKEGVEPVVISSPDAAEGAAPLIHQRCVVVKLHGDYLDDRIKNTEAELGRYDLRMDAYLDRVLDEFGLIVCGWSGEWDPALRAAIERCKSRRYTTYWAANCAPGERATALVGLRQAQLLNIKDADSLFAALEDKVASLEELNAPAPLTAEAAVASLKRYVVEPRHRIRLHDLVMDEVNRVRHQLANQLPASSHAANPAPEEFLRRMRLCEAATAILRALFFHGGRWAEPEHAELFAHALHMLVPSNTEGTAFTAWIGMQRYPAAILFYAGGLGAVASGNYRFLRALLGVKFRHNHEDLVAGRDLAAMAVLEHGLAQASLYQPSPNRRKTPVSDNLADLLMPLAAGSVADPEALFDRLEVMIALNYLDSAEEPQWMPPGRYCWKGYSQTTAPATALMAEAEEMGADWPPLKAGMFNGTVERLRYVVAAFRETYKEVGRRFWF